ncbi:MAG TPA: glycoside hydrolase family 2 TIM barrel-domain containing protein [Solirubrobacteraceae bacterium]|nr:glycoside hydrolase family 2 TIM barrel-domain containing protein [Solirubrobacteraceae bacterium]
MPSLRLPATVLSLLAALAAATLFAPVPAAAAADGITRGTIYQDGPDNRYLLGGEWLFRRDDPDAGVRQSFQRQAARDGWSALTVPNAWNVGDNSAASMTGTVAWYRKDFRLPDARARMDWLVRFESVNYRSRVWLNGVAVGRNTGAYLPFDLRLPRTALKRSGMNRLVIRVDNRRLRTDFPPSGLTGSGDPAGGWWNYGGLLREVYLQRVDKIDVTNVVVRPELRCARCVASVLARVVVRNYANRTASVRVTGSFGGRPLNLGSRRVAGRSFASFQTRLRVPQPRLWSPSRPYLYRARFTVRDGGRRVLGYKLHSGIRSITLAGGRLMLNGRPVSLRGVGLHEDDPVKGFAIDSARRAQIAGQAKELGATMIRSHYPLHPELHELADRLGLLVWSEIPVYAVKTQFLKREAVRKLAARELESNIIANQNHPSIMLWSIGNELSARPGPVQQFYIQRAVRQAKALDPTRPVGLAVAGYPAAGCRPQYAALDVIGINDYFGWYPGPNGQIADRDALPDYLDSVRACYPNEAIFVSEFGAEANRDGPVEEKGTYQYQQDFINYHLAVHAARPWLSGSLYWALQEFRVRPNWDGGNPRPNPPIHEKGLLRFDGSKKPAWFDVQRQFAATNQLGGH